MSVHQTIEIWDSSEVRRQFGFSRARWHELRFQDGFPKPIQKLTVNGQSIHLHTRAPLYRADEILAYREAKRKARGTTGPRSDTA